MVVVHVHDTYGFMEKEERSILGCTKYEFDLFID